MLTVYNEKKYAESMIENGFVDNARGQALYILAKYYKIEEQLDKKQVKEKLIEFCRKHISGYDYSDYYKTVNTCVANCFKKDNLLLQVDCFYIKDCEIKYIQSIDVSQELKKALFTMLCILRLSQSTVKEDLFNNKINYGKNGINVKKCGNFKTKTKIMTDIMHPLYKKGLIGLSDGSTKAKLNFLDCVDSTQEQALYKVSDLNNFGLWWDKYIMFDKKVIECVSCGKLLRRKCNRQLMCNECAEESIKEYDRERKSNF